MTRRLLLWLLAGLAPIAAQDIRARDIRPLTILHSNDLHAHLLSDDLDRGGFARLATAVLEEKQNCVACLYLNAGDLVQGTPVSTIYHGVPVYQIANLLGFDAATIGNHEFDYGWKRVQEFAGIANYPLLSANVVDADGATLTGKSFVIKTVGGIRVAIIGVVLGDLSGTYVTPDKVEPWRVLPVVETVRKYAQELKDRSDLIVVLGHIHDQEEVDAILHQVPEVSVVVVGHNHNGYPEMRNVDGRVAVLAHGYGVELGRLDLKVDMAGKKLQSAEWKRIPIDAKFQPEPKVAHEIAGWEAKVSKIVDVPIGESKKRLEGRELQLLLEQALAEETGSDLAFVNRGGVRDVIPEGRVLARAVWNIQPFDNMVVVGTFKGSELPAAIREGHSIEPDREYKVATLDFVATNQAAQFKTTGLKFPVNTGILARDMVIDWIRKRRLLP
jgi:2',3'-cyclic-nucleotide 2'-phosphodiesterase (5'-nucleotidase family)